MRGWIYLLDPSCCLPLTMPDCFRIATDPFSVVDALGSFPLPPCSSCARHTLRLRGLRATCHLTLRLPVRSLRPPHAFAHTSVPRTRSSHLAPCVYSSPLAPAPCARPWHPFFVLALRVCPMRLPLAVPRVLSALVSSLSRPSVSLPSPARSALCLLLPLSAPLLVLSAFCPSFVHSTPPRLPPAFPTLPALYPCLIPT